VETRERGRGIDRRGWDRGEGETGTGKGDERMNACQGEEGGQEGGNREGKGRGISPPPSFLKVGAYVP